MSRFLEFSALRPSDWMPVHTSDVVSWQPHIPFAFALMKNLRPASLVELGTHKGDSYLAFCEAARRYSTGTVCRAVDSWRGDPQAREYGDEVLHELRARHDPEFGHFSTLTQSTFDDALPLVPDGSLDLLHIDGFHTYEAVRHDFESWQPKLSRRGVVLFHDTEVRRDDFGVHLLWAELRNRFGGFSFLHGFGLGVLPVGPEAASSLPDLFQVGENTRDEIRALYRSLGYAIAYENLLDAINDERTNNARENYRLHGEIAKQQALLKEIEEKLRKVENSGFCRLLTRLDSVAASLIDISTGWLNSLVILVCGRGWNFFDADFYRREYPGIERAQRRPFVDYALNGFRAGRKPNESNNLPPTLAWMVSVKQHCKTSDASDLSPRQELSSDIGFRDALAECMKCAARGWLPEPIRRALLYLRRPDSPRALPPWVPPVRNIRPLAFPEASAPSVSIVIAVHGQRDCIYRCLRSLRVHRSKYSFEVIVVDDVSPDDTPSMLSRMRGIKLITNESNLGFIKSCNKGASEARGELLVMLNSDTVVQPGWLDELVDTFNAFPDAGLVGSKLVYPDGTLQEAGGLIWSDGSGWNIGRNGDASAPEHNYLREVDYCSGASIMVPRDLWSLLGGFDEDYAPAYAEDSDLAFRIRAAGRRVFYQPLSVALHYEGMSCGRDTSLGVKSYQVTNAAKLRERWREQMLCLGEPGRGPHKAKDRNVTGRLLVLDHCIPTPDQDAGSITVFNIMRIFRSLGWKVTFTPEDNFLRTDPYTPDMQRIGIECLYHPYVNSVRRHLEQHGRDYDAVLVFRSTCLQRHLQTIRDHAPQAKIIYHTSDLHYLREQREAELYGSEEMRKKASETRHVELALVEAVDATVVHSSEEKQHLQQETGGRAKISLFPWAIDVPGTRSDWEVRDGLVFVGGFQHTPNIDAVLYFAGSIWPLVRRRLPDAVFRIVGSRAPREIRGLHGGGIEVCGFLPDLAATLDRTRVMVVSLRFGAGIKGKIGTSLSHGLPVVTTSVGAEGMDLQDGDGVLVADEPAEFVDRIVSLCNDRPLWERESRGGIEFAQRKYSLQAGSDLIAALLRDLGLDKLVAEQRAVPLVEGLSHAFHCGYPPDFAGDPLIDTAVFPADQVSEVNDHFASRNPLHRDRENEIISAMSDAGRYLHQGFCRICGHEAEFAFAKESGGSFHAEWGGQLICTTCGLGNRQRAVVHALAHHLGERIKDRPADLCVVSEEPPLTGFARRYFRGAQIVSGEYFCSSAGRVDAGYDAVLISGSWSNEPLLGRILERSRLSLRPRGYLFMPYFPAIGSDQRGERADAISGASSESDILRARFGFDPLQALEEAGFQNASLCFYWSDVYGHLGADQCYVSARVA
jgi:GT2 family glycosyltransferase